MPNLPGTHNNPLYSFSQEPLVYTVNILIFSSPYSIPVEPASVCVCVCVCVYVCVSTLSNMNISETRGPMATKFYLKHYWAGGN